MLTIAATAVVHAEGAPEPDVAERYPRALVDRPVVLPRGGNEGSVGFVLMERSFDGKSHPIALVEPHLRAAIGTVEIELGASVMLLERLDLDYYVPLDTLAELSGAVRHGLRPDLSIGLEIEVGSPTSYVTVATHGVVTRKVRVGTAAALEASFALGEIYREDRPAFSGNEPYLEHAFSAIGQLRAQAQLAAALALEARARIAFNSQPAGHTGLDNGVRMLASLTPIVELSVGLDVYTTGSSVEVFTIGVGVAFRRVP